MIICWQYPFLCRTDYIDYRRTDQNRKFKLYKQGQTVPNMITIMGQLCIFLFQVKQNKTDKNWARYSIVDDLANKYKQCLSAHSNQMICKYYTFYSQVKSVGL